MVGVELDVGYVVVAGVFCLLLFEWGGEGEDSFVEILFADLGLLQAFRKINAVTVPKMVGVPKNDEEDAARGNQ